MEIGELSYRIGCSGLNACNVRDNRITFHQFQMCVGVHGEHKLDLIRQTNHLSVVFGDFTIIRCVCSSVFSICTSSICPSLFRLAVMHSTLSDALWAEVYSNRKFTFSNGFSMKTWINFTINLKFRIKFNDDAFVCRTFRQSHLQFVPVKSFTVHLRVEGFDHDVSRIQETFSQFFVPRNQRATDAIRIKCTNLVWRLS